MIVDVVLPAMLGSVLLCEYPGRLRGVNVISLILIGEPSIEA